MHWLGTSPFECPRYRQLNCLFSVALFYSGRYLFSRIPNPGMAMTLLWVLGRMTLGTWCSAVSAAMSSCIPWKCSSRINSSHSRVFYMCRAGKGPTGWLAPESCSTFTEWPTEKKPVESSSVLAVRKWQIHSDCSRQISGQPVTHLTSFWILSFKKHFLFIHVYNIFWSFLPISYPIFPHKTPQLTPHQSTNFMFFYFFFLFSL